MVRDKMKPDQLSPPSFVFDGVFTRGYLEPR
jgi:hypothetical protein